MKEIRRTLTWLLLMIMLLVDSVTASADEMKVHFLDVGQGLSILVQCDGQTVGQTEAVQEETQAPQAEVTQANPGDGQLVWLSATGSKYHSRNNCGRMNPDKAYQVTQSEAEAQGYGRCSKCW